MRKICSFLAFLMVVLAFSPQASGARKKASSDQEEPIITIKSDAYNEIGVDNQFGLMLGSSETDFFDIDAGFGAEELEVDPWTIENGAIKGTYKSVKVGKDGLIRIYGDPSKIDMIQIQGGYVTEIDMEKCVNLEVLDLSHNSLKKLDLTPFTNLYAIYLSDNPFTKETPLKVGAPKNQLAILEIDIVDHLDQSFNLSDYPAMQAFDGYHNLDLWNVDPTGCPELLTMSLELSNVSSLDVSKNPKLLSLNISETRITSIDLSNNTQLTTLMAENRSGFINQEYYLHDVDLSPLPNLQVLYLGGNRLENVDLSNNTKLTNLNLADNRLTSLDISKNTALYSVTINRNNMDFATLPAPQDTWGEYFYQQNDIPVSKSIEVNTTLDLSSKVLRPGTETTASLWVKGIDGYDSPADASIYEYADGKIKFIKETADSVYVKYSNSLLAEYQLSTTNFVVKKGSELGQPSQAVTLVPGTSANANFAVSVGMYGASEENPVTFYVDFGNGVRKEFTARTSGLPASPNVLGTVTPGTSVSFYVPEEKSMTAFGISGMSLTSLDVRNATELRELRINETELADIDLRYNRCLESLNLDNNALPSLDLTGLYANWDKNVLLDISAANNELTEVTIVSTTQIRKLNLSGNKLTEYSLKNYDSLKELDLSDNALAGQISLTYQGAAESIDLSGNMLTEVVYDTFENLGTFNLSDNRFTLETLPYRPGASDYIYAPQKPIELLKNAPAVNLSEQNRVIDGKGTTFVWKKADGTKLVEGVDIECVDGQTRFLSDKLGEVYCEMTNPAFPDFSGENVFRTTLVNTVAAPTKIVATFTTLENSNDGELIIASEQGTAIYVDWRGDGSEYIPYVANKDDNYNAYNEIRTFKNAKVKVYTYDDAQDLKVFSLYGIKMSEFDGTPMTKLLTIALGDAGLEKSNIHLPDAPLVELNLSGNKIDENIWSEKYHDLTSLNFSSNNLTTFDATPYKELRTLYLSDNQLTDVKFDNPRIWEVALSGNKFETIDLSGLKRLEQLWIFDNMLSTIDLSALKGTLKVLNIAANRFTFATLPLPTDYPRLAIYTYGSQAEVPAIVSDDRMTFDLSSQAVVDEVFQTTYTWFLGEPVYDSETGELSGEVLYVDDEYTIENGVTTFTTRFSDDVVCVMTNDAFPQAFLRTPAYRVGQDVGSVENVASEDDVPVNVFTLSGIIVKRGVKMSEALDNLSEGIYIVNGKKVFIK